MGKLGKKVIIIGGVAGGATAATRLRRLDENLEIVLIEKGRYISYANCGLPYFIGNVISDKHDLLVKSPEEISKRFNIDVRVNSKVYHIYPETKQIAVIDLKNGKKYKEKYWKLLLSPGSHPFNIDVPGIHHNRVFNLKNIPDAEKIKHYIEKNNAKKAVILGAGPISLEISENLKKQGIDVSIIELLDHVLSPIDKEIAVIIENHLKAQGINIYLNSQVLSIDHNENISKVNINGGKSAEAEIIILAIGVRPETELAQKAGLKIGKTGGILVNKNFQTSNSSIFAVGDAIEITEYISGKKALIALAGPANKQGRIVAENILGKKVNYNGSQGTGVLKIFDLTAAMTGLNEKILEKYSIPFESIILHSSSHAGYYPGALPLTLKLLFSSSGNILGAQGVGFEGVEKRIDVISAAIRGKMKISDLAEIDLCYAPPYSSAKDPVNVLANMALNINDNLVNTFPIKNLNKIDIKKDIILDVRNKSEFKTGKIKGAINIPLDDLRKNLKKISKRKIIYVYCSTGLRSYLACRILSQNSYKCFNLSGGFKTYEDIKGLNINKEEDVYITEKAIKENDFFEEKDNSKVDFPIIIKIKLNACGLSCPGPLQKVYKAFQKLKDGEIMEIKATDPAFDRDISMWCKRTANELLSLKKDKGVITAVIRKGKHEHVRHIEHLDNHNKTLIIFSDDIDRIIASFIIANGAASMGRKVTMFFTFWGLNVLRKSGHLNVKKDLISKAFGFMMPKGSSHLHLSQMNMGGIGTKLIRWLMKKKRIGTLEELINQAKEAGVKMVACSTSMDIMGIKKEELIDGVEIGGVSMYLGEAEEADTNLFI